MPFLHTVILNAIYVRKYNILANEAHVLLWNTVFHFIILVFTKNWRKLLLKNDG